MKGPNAFDWAGCLIGGALVTFLDSRPFSGLHWVGGWMLGKWLATWMVRRRHE